MLEGEVGNLKECAADDDCPGTEKKCCAVGDGSICVQPDPVGMYHENVRKNKGKEFYKHVASFPIPWISKCTLEVLHVLKVFYILNKCSTTTL